MGYNDTRKVTTTVTTQVWSGGRWVNESKTETVEIEERSGD